MKKLMFMIAFFVFVLMSVFAQGFYFDIGLGIGGSSTKINGIDISSTFYGVDELGGELGLKAGYGPIGNKPIYVVGELSGSGHRIFDSHNYLQLNSYLIGPGIIFYPIPLIQLGLSLGYSWISNQTDLPGFVMYGSDEGFAWNISAAVDLGRGNHGCLIGLKYFGATNKLKISYAEQQASFLGVFIKYAFRQKH